MIINIDTPARFKYPPHKSLKIIRCVYCRENTVAKRGFRKKKHEKVQLYYCKSCRKTFTEQEQKGEVYPLHIIIEGLIYYYQGFNLDETTKYLYDKFDTKLDPGTIRSRARKNCMLFPYTRLRKQCLRLSPPAQTIREITLNPKHTFRYHLPKTQVRVQENNIFRDHRRLSPLKELLDTISAQYPADVFLQAKPPARKLPPISPDKVKTRKLYNNHAVSLAGFVLESRVKDKLYVETLQRFMLAVDSATVACNLPVLLIPDNIKYLRKTLNLKLPPVIDNTSTITGHIDFVQIRNNKIYIMEYKPAAAAKKPFVQLAIYALALSQMTGLRLYDFKCAWFDEKNYFEFYPWNAVK
ncbi:hypothetical protein ACFL57_04815 [Candidatus Margulisiibacteriota bacterium]